MGKEPPGSTKEQQLGVGFVLLNKRNLCQKSGLWKFEKDVGNTRTRRKKEESRSDEDSADRHVTYARTTLLVCHRY